MQDEENRTGFRLLKVTLDPVTNPIAIAMEQARIKALLIQRFTKCVDDGRKYYHEIFPVLSFEEASKELIRPVLYGGLIVLLENLEDAQVGEYVKTIPLELAGAQRGWRFETWPSDRTFGPHAPVKLLSTFEIDFIPTSPFGPELGIFNPRGYRVARRIR